MYFSNGEIDDETVVQEGDNGLAGEEPGTGSTDICELLQPAQGTGVTGTLPAEFEEEVELAINNWVSPRARRLFFN